MTKLVLSAVKSWDGFSDSLWLDCLYLIVKLLEWWADFSNQTKDIKQLGEIVYQMTPTEEYWSSEYEELMTFMTSQLWYLEQFDCQEEIAKIILLQFLDQLDGIGTSQI